jgi:glutamate/tyrosine decarboxylase-like PLP-dependent enzyme
MPGSSACGIASYDAAARSPSATAGQQRARRAGEDNVTELPHEQRIERAASDLAMDEFRVAGHRLVDALANFYESLPTRPVTRGETVRSLRALLPPRPLPEAGRPAPELLDEITPFLIEHSLHNGHPRFFGYITSSAAPLGALADLLASGINQNCGLRDLSPAANEIEMQAVQWLAELVGYPTPCGGIMVSGGNMANILALLAARHAKLGPDVRRDGLRNVPGRPRIYASQGTHTWLQKAVDVAGLGTDAVRWVATDRDQRIDPTGLPEAIARDRAAGDLPFLLIGTAGNVSTGAVDALDALAAIARQHGLWFHVDGAYGAPAACLPDAPAALKALALADSLALDPHKWLYAPIEVACTLVRNPDALRDAFSFRPPYYRLGDEADAGSVDYFEHGLQNTRGFRALKVWLGLQQAGRAGYEAQIRGNIALAARLAEIVRRTPGLEPGTRHLSIATFRYRPADSLDGPEWRGWLDELNRQLLVDLQRGGEAYLSNAVFDDGYFLRACIVNFRTRESDIDELVASVLRSGSAVEARLRPTRPTLR